MNKRHHWARTTNTGLLYPKVRNNIGGDIPIDVHPTKILEGMTCPRHLRRGRRQCMRMHDIHSQSRRLRNCSIVARRGPGYLSVLIVEANGLDGCSG